MVTKLDELKILRSEPYDKYFGIMNIPVEGMRQRIDFSERFESMITAIMNTISVMMDYNSVNWQYIEDMIVDGYNAIIADFVEPDDYTQEITTTYANDFIKATQNAITEDNTLRDLYILSVDRAMYNAENEANTSLNYGDYKDALAAGYTRKTWHTEMDNRVRPTHVPMEGVTIPIFDYFNVAGSYMRFPRDTSLFASSDQIVNCRCSVEYS